MKGGYFGQSDQERPEEVTTGQALEQVRKLVNICKENRNYKCLEVES